MGVLHCDKTETQLFQFLELGKGSYVNISIVIKYIFLDCNITTKSVTLIFYIYMLEDVTGCEVFMGSICSFRLESKPKELKFQTCSQDMTIDFNKILHILPQLHVSTYSLGLIFPLKYTMSCILTIHIMILKNSITIFPFYLLHDNIMSQLKMRSQV